MFRTLREKESFEPTKSEKDILSQQQKVSTQNGSTCKTIPSQTNSQFVSAQLQTSQVNSLLINNLMERIKKMQKAQIQAKQKFQMCISTLSKQIAKKDLQNKKIKDEAQILRVQIAEEKKDLQTIKLYASKLSSKSGNWGLQKATRNYKREEKQSNQTKEHFQQQKEKIGFKSRGKLFKKATVIN